MKLIVGLGNPGQKYKDTRHNAGYIALDEALKIFNLKMKLDVRFKSEIAFYQNLAKKAIFLKPVTYMNRSGEAVKSVIDFYKIEIDDVLVIVDDIHLETGKLRLRELGGHGGHNGLRHIIEVLNTKDFKRVRIGIGLENNMPLDSYVLGKFKEDEKALLEKACRQTAEAIEMFINEIPYKDIMTKYNTQT